MREGTNKSLVEEGAKEKREREDSVDDWTEECRE